MKYIYIWASAWDIPGVLMTIQSTPTAMLFKDDVHVSVSGDRAGASSARAVGLLASWGAFTVENLAVPKILPLLWRTGTSDSTLTIRFCCLFTVVFQVLNCRLCPTSVFTEAFLYLPMHFRCCRKETCSLLPILPPASSCTSVKLCISKSHSWSSLGLPSPAGASHLILFPLAVSHLFQCLVTFWCQQLSLSAQVS